VKRVLVLARKLASRILRPIFLKQAELFRQLADTLEYHDHRLFAHHAELDALRKRQQDASIRLDQMSARLDELSVRLDEQARLFEGMTARLDEQADHVQTTMAFGWDYVALVRRLATIEDQLAALTGSSAGASPADEGEVHPSILFPGLEATTRRPGSGGGEDPEHRSKVC
jgi:chromosome segregation ATPase